MGSNNSDMRDVRGLAEVYSLAPDTFSDSAHIGRMHPICEDSALTDLEQDVEQELRNRGFEFVGRTYHPSTSHMYRPGKWALDKFDYAPKKSDLGKPLKKIVDAIVKGTA